MSGEALKLSMDIVIASFDSMSEVNMDYTITLYLHQYWRDERLAWDRDANESMTLRLEGDGQEERRGRKGREGKGSCSGDFSKAIWVPDTFLANDKHSFLHDVTETNKMLRLYSDGFISYGMRSAPRPSPPLPYATRLPPHTHRPRGVASRVEQPLREGSLDLDWLGSLTLRPPFFGCQTSCCPKYQGLQLVLVRAQQLI